MANRGQVGATARALGFAGLLPQIAAIGLLVLGHNNWTLLLAGFGLAMLYGGVILSFLGGIWWGFAMRRETGQGALAVVAIVPSLAAVALAIAASLAFDRLTGWPAALLGSAILLTLPVDRRLADNGEAPEGWMRLRMPLSLGLGALTILAGVLAGLTPPA